MKNLTLDTAKEMCRDKELTGAAYAVVSAKALVDTIRPGVEKIQRAVLEEFGIRDANGNLITKTGNLFKFSEKVTDPFFARLDEALLAAGYRVERPGHCPLFEPESVLRRATCDFFDLTSKYTGAERYQLLMKHDDDGVNFYDKYIELTLSLVISKERGE